MGVVYRAEHVELKKLAAVKLLLPAMSVRREIVARFFNEARAAAAIRHPGIVDVYDSGVQDDGSAYIVMEYLSGESLADRLAREGPMALHPSLAIIGQAARAIGAAHAAGIVHRDLKPDNIFLVADQDIDCGIRLKILDFGIAKLAQDTNARGLTSTGAAMGTPAYMPPEQWVSAGEVDQRSDIYALGCVIFEMLCGHPPFERPGVMEFADAHRFVPAPSPSQVRPELPSAIDGILGKALAKAPADRYATMNELAQAIANVGRLSAQSRRHSINSIGDDTSQAHLILESAGTVRGPTQSLGKWWMVAGLGAVAVVSAAIAVVLVTGSSGRSAGIDANTTKEIAPPVEPAGTSADAAGGSAKPGTAFGRESVDPSATRPRLAVGYAGTTGNPPTPTFEVQRAEARKEAWIRNATLSDDLFFRWRVRFVAETAQTRLQASARKKEPGHVGIDRSEYSCAIQFDEWGSPSELTNCKMTSHDGACGKRLRRMKATKVVCAQGTKDLLCKWSAGFNYCDSGWKDDRYYFILRRPIIPEDSLDGDQGG